MNEWLHMEPCDRGKYGYFAIKVTNPGTVRGWFFTGPVFEKTTFVVDLTRSSVKCWQSMCHLL
eukprot:GDKH01011816.1.p2 GENE.GDKH01011816.1~~GDKH01011816.1.p2  ORF type:complete len:63 (-),score=3.24 GDKH01011816.1:408-596(-)